MAKVRMTCPKEEALSMDEDIEKFCKKYMTSDEINWAEDIVKSLLSSGKKKEKAIEMLRDEVGEKPKRPLFYVYMDMEHLPFHTRSLIRDIGDFIDHLIKFSAAEILKDKKYLERSLGSNVRNLKGKVEDNLHNDLEEYNQLIYVPAKHKFSVKDRNHLITTKEAVYIILATMNLARQITQISQRARDYAENKIYN